MTVQPFLLFHSGTFCSVRHDIFGHFFFELEVLKGNFRILRAKGYNKCFEIVGASLVKFSLGPDNDGVTAWGWSGPNLVSRAVAADVERAHPDRHVEDLSKTRLIVSR